MSGIGKQGVEVGKGGVFDTSSPSSRIRPSEGDSKPANMRSVVVFPQPDGPSMEKNSPLPIEKSAFFTAVNLSNRLVTLSMTMTSSGASPWSLTVA